MRFGFIPILGSISCIASWFYAGFVNIELGGIFFVMSFNLMVIGLNMVFFFPYKKDKHKLIPLYRISSLGFAIVAIPGTLGMIYPFEINLKWLIIVTSVFMAYGMYRSSK